MNKSVISNIGSIKIKKASSKKVYLKPLVVEGFKERDCYNSFNKIWVLRDSFTMDTFF